MLYIDPKDHEIATTDSVLYRAWLDRKNMRMEHFDLGRKIEALDSFIEMYVARACPDYKLVQQQTVTSSTLHAGFSNTHSSSVQQIKE